MLAVLASALFAGAIATLVTIAIEKWGGVAGGVFGTVPTTIIPAAAGIVVSGGELDTAMAVIPWGMLLNGIFLLLWVVLPDRFGLELWGTTAASLAIWILLAAGMLKLTSLTLEVVSPQVMGGIGTVLLMALGIVFNFKPRAAPKGSKKVTKAVLAMRGIAAALAIGVCVYVSELGYPILAGIAAVFPAIFLTSMVALWLAQGSDVPRGAAGPMMLGGASVSIYSIVAMYSLPEHGIILGSIIAWLVSVILWTTPMGMWLSHRATKTSLQV